MESVEAVPVERTVVAEGHAERGERLFDEFYADSYAAMVRLAWSLVDQRDVAEEVVQDAFAAMYLRYGALSDPAAYLRVCVMNGCRRVLRRRRTARRKPAAVAPTAIDDDHDHLFDVIRRLPPRQRAVVVLRYQQGLGDNEIASALGIPVGSVKSSLSRAKESLRKELSS